MQQTLQTTANPGPAGAQPLAPAAVPAAAAGAEPFERLMFQLTDLVDNHNKFYLVELWPAPGHGAEVVRFRASWGRVGSAPQVKEKLAPRSEVERVILEKRRKGYRPVDLHTPEVELAAPADGGSRQVIAPEVARLVDWIFAEAGEHISSYLAVPVDALSQAQIEEGRRLLAQAQQQHLHYLLNPFKRSQNMAAIAETVQLYYNAIPTRLPARIKIEDVVQAFCKEFDDQEERLNQLEAAIATIKARRTHPGLSQYQSLGAELRLLARDEEARRALVDYITRTQVHGYSIRVKDVFEVHIPEERRTYAANKRGASHRELLFHGTRNQNVRHILRTGLITPRAASNGRMLGNGIYLANRASKSTNYCASSSRSIPQMLFVVEAALGNVFVAPKAKGFDEPPRGYDSVCGKGGYTQAGVGYTLVNDEFVVYSPAQQTIRYLVTFER